MKVASILIQAQKRDKLKRKIKPPQASTSARCAGTKKTVA
jgi:hypothetical protein